MKKGKFVLGAIVGAAAAVLLSPITGSEARKALGKKINELKVKIQDIDFKDVREEFEIKVFEIQNELESLDKEKAIKIAKEKANLIKLKSEELLAYAEEKGTPVLKEMAEDIKESTKTVLKEAIKKIEASEKKTK